MQITFFWKKNIEGILRSKKLWKKVIDVKLIEDPNKEDSEYNEKC